MTVIFAGEGSMREMPEMMEIAVRGLSLLGSLFLFALGLLVIAVVILFIVDVTQTKIRCAVITP